jgi:hypothetical protein
MITRKAKITIATVLGAATLGGGAIAASVSSSDPSTELATALSKQTGQTITPDQVKGAFQDVMKAHLDAEVAAGRLTQAQADSMLAAAKDGNGPRLGGPGFGPDGDHHRGFGPGPLGPRADLITPLSTLLKVTPTDLRAKLKAGSSLADVAKTQSVTRADLLAAIKKAFPTPPAGATGPTAAQQDQLAGHIADEKGGPGRGRHRGDRDGGPRGQVGQQPRGQYQP